MLHRIFGFPLSLAILPAQFLFYTKDKTLPSDHREGNINITFKSTPSTGRAHISFTELYSNQAHRQNIKKQKIIIHATGNGDCYERHIEDYYRLANSMPSARVVGFNLRGVRKSTGWAWSENDWIDDTISVINYYRRQGVPSKNIVLSGHSLGGAVLTMAAAKLYEQEKNSESVNVLNNRSFSSLSDVVVKSFLSTFGSALILFGIFSPLLWLATTITLLNSFAIVGGLLAASTLLYKETPKILLKPIIEGILWLTFGTMNASKAYQKLPEGSKDYVYAKDDQLILKASSLHQSLKPQRTQMKALINQARQTRRTHEQLLNMKDSSLCIKDVHRSEYGKYSHVLPLSYLQTHHQLREKLSGQEVLFNKIRRLAKITPRSK